MSPRSERYLCFLVAGLLAASPQHVSAAPPDRAATEHFEKNVRPLLLAKCVGCHGPEKQKGGLRLDASGIARGGETGPAVVPGKPDDSLLIRAVRHTEERKMPPSGKLRDQEIAHLVAWVKAGAVWPGAGSVPALPPAQSVRILEPNDAPLRPRLRAWYRADRLLTGDGKPVHVWPDSSGKGRDLTATRGVRAGGVGQPGTFVAVSTINGRPAVRFGSETGLATSPDLPVDIKGDSAFTIVLVMNLQPTAVPHLHDGILGIGNPANATGNPGKPLAALVQITRHGGTDAQAELQLAGGWNHDASLGRGSFAPCWNRPVLLSIVKQPGPMRSTTRFFIDGVPSEESFLKRKVEGVEAVPDIRHRDDIGLYLGKALGWCGSIRGDLGEVIVYNAALSDADRAALEIGLADRHGFRHSTVLAQSRTTFTAAQKAFWAFQPVKPVTPPEVRNVAWVASPVDRFVLARLEAAQLRPAPPADRRTLLRRVTFDLTGLPPTPQETDAFLADERPDAFARVVDRLLASPHHGERWARHWLDVVRYAETTANDANAVLRYAWRYRDQVAKALNADQSYDEFILEQLAGDLLLPLADRRRNAERIIATGFLMVGPKALAETDKEQSRLDIIDDQIDTTGRAFLGLTISCARCHDHKFDPIPAVDYYSLAGIFRGTEVFRDDVRNASMWHEWPLPQLPGEPPVQVMAPKDGRATSLRVALRGNRQTPGIVAPRRFLQIVAGEGHAPLATSQSGRLELARWIASRDNPLTARVLVNRVWQHHFGTGLVATSDNFGVRGEPPSHPELLDWLAGEFVRSGWSIKALHRLMLLSSTYQMSSRADSDGMKADPNNRLLWRMPLRRLDAESLRDALLAVSGQLARVVGGNESGELLFQQGEVIDRNRDFFRPNRVQTDHAIYTNSTRRSLYLPVVRNAIPDLLTLFDGADPNGVTTARNDTTVPAQALLLLNHPFVREQSLHLARRLLADPQSTAAVRVALGFRLALGRTPAASELSEVTSFIARYESLATTQGRKPDEARLAAWQSFCQTLLCRNEFLYVE